MPAGAFLFGCQALADIKSAAGVADTAAVAAAEEENEKDDDNPAAVASAKSTVAVHKKTLLYKMYLSLALRAAQKAFARQRFSLSGLFRFVLPS
ncbi:hypothetical protein [Huintestinicola sp.]|uniref:hypothetical protein n=1 Tax=Huintestinicola sp. TaxID=2981661 RepID=UPI003D7C515B